VREIGGTAVIIRALIDMGDRRLVPHGDRRDPARFCY
jgi:hypothetical protein